MTASAPEVSARATCSGRSAGTNKGRMTSIAEADNWIFLARCCAKYEAPDLAPPIVIYWAPYSIRQYRRWGER